MDSLSDNAVYAMPWLFDIWGRSDQLEPEGNWSTWLVMGGRGCGKTRTGAEWIRSQVEGDTPLSPGKVSRIALIAETADQARDIMILGESGIMSVTPQDRRPELYVSRRRLVWPNGAEAKLFSAKDPESLRGPQFDCAWLDEFAKWRKASEAWDMLQFGLRLGKCPRQIVTTTPRHSPALMRLIEESSVVVTSAPTIANYANLSRSFFEQITNRYAGTALGRQELEGELLVEVPGALWSRDCFEQNRMKQSPVLGRIVVAVDPAISSKSSSDECGIIVAGVDTCGSPVDWKAYVLADFSVRGCSPRGWAERAVSAYHTFKADRLIAETNQGGDMVGEIIRQVDSSVSFKGVTASRGKVLRAEPVSALYEQGRVSHVGVFKELENQMSTFSHGGIRKTMFSTSGSPDRVDALVWAITELLINTGNSGNPRIRSLR